jgi:hypothetical protein
MNSWLTMSIAQSGRLGADQRLARQMPTCSPLPASIKLSSLHLTPGSRVRFFCRSSSGHSQRELHACQVSTQSQANRDGSRALPLARNQEVRCCRNSSECPKTNPFRRSPILSSGTSATPMKRSVATRRRLRKGSMTGSGIFLPGQPGLSTRPAREG